MPNSSEVTCRYHPEATLIEDHRAGDMICFDCGLVVVDRAIDVHSEWRTFADDSASKNRSRVGPEENPLFRGNNLGTIIVKGKGRASFDSEDNTKYISRSWTTTSSVPRASDENPTSNRTLLSAFRTISDMADKINIPKVVTDRANLLFKAVRDGGKVQGHKNGVIAAACLYIACRQENVPRTFKEIVAVTSENKKQIGRCFQMICKAHVTNVDAIKTDDFMGRFCAKLNLKPYVQKGATRIAWKASELFIVSGRSPISVAAAAIYMASQASDDKKTQKEIVEVTGVADVTIRQNYKLMLPRAKKLFPKDFTFHTEIENLPSC